MGMGKTIQTIGLLLSEPKGKPNLVVAPTVALMQWKSEIETHTQKRSNSLFLSWTVTRPELERAGRLRRYPNILSAPIVT